MYEEMTYQKMKERRKSIYSIEDKEAMLWKVDGKICRRIGLEFPAEGPKDREEAIKKGIIFVPSEEFYFFPQPDEYLLPEEEFPETAYAVRKAYCGERPFGIFADERSGPGLRGLLLELTLVRDFDKGEIRKKELESHYLKKIK